MNGRSLVCQAHISGVSIGSVVGTLVSPLSMRKPQVPPQPLQSNQFARSDLESEIARRNRGVHGPSAHKSCVAEGPNHQMLGDWVCRLRESAFPAPSVGTALRRVDSRELSSRGMRESSGKATLEKQPSPARG